MKKHKVRKEPVHMGTMLDADMQKMFNFLRMHYGLTSNSVLVRFLAKQAYDQIQGVKNFRSDCQ